MGYIPIEAKFLQSNWRLALGFRTGYVWLRVLGVEPMLHRPFTRGLTPIPPNGTLPEVELKDADGNPLFDVTKEMANEIVYHVGIGINPPYWIRCYPRYPSGSRRGEIEAFSPVSLGGDYGYFTGEDSPYSRPTDAMEFIFPYGVKADFGFANKDNEYIHQPVFNISARKYRIEILDPRVPEHANIIKTTASGGQCYWYTVGRVSAPADYRLKPYWGVEPMSIADARGLKI